MNQKGKITGLSILVLAQVILFVLVYLSTIAVGAGLVYLAFHASIWLIPPFFENVAPEIMRLGKLGVALLVGIVIGIVGLWAFIVAIGIYLVKPLFLFPRREHNYGREIQREDSPKLYDMIMETAKSVGVRKPKHIYVNHEVNACVFFNTGFWNIFFPVRKNLAIGLGLFSSTNTEEVRSIIAHEFGHFAQGSMRVGSVLYVANKVITDLAYRRDKLDSLMLRWCLEDGIWGFWGKATQSVVIKFRNLIDVLFRSQQRNYMKLSRQMEYDADAVACRLVGKETFVSALCKIQQNAKAFDFYNRVLGNFLNQNQIVSDYWKGYNLTVPNMKSMDFHISTFNSVEVAPEEEDVHSRIIIEEIWESHPSIRKRIEHAPNNETNHAGEYILAWDLVSDTLKTEVSETILNQAKKDNSSINELNWNNFKNMLEKKIELSIFPNEVEPFFNRNILDDANVSQEENPLNDSNRLVVLEYEQAIRDMDTLDALYKGKIPVKYFIYNGREYNIENTPVNEHRQYLESLKDRTKIIDGAIRTLALSKAHKSELIEAAYDAILYTQSITDRISNDFLSVKQDIIKELNQANIAGEEDFESLRGWLDSYETALKDVLGSLKYRQLVPFMTKEEHEHMIGFLDASRSFSNGINSDAINHMFAVTDWIMQVHGNMNHTAKMVVVNTLLDKNLPNTDFLNLWGVKEPEEEVSEVERTEPDNKEHVIIDSAHGQLNLAIPTDEEIDTVYYQEWFRYRMWEKFDSLERGQKFDYSLVATIPFKEEEGRITNINPEDEPKFMAEIEEYYRFLSTTVYEDNWEVISDEADKGSAHANSRMAELYISQNRFNLAFDSAMKGALGGDPDGMVMLGVLEGNGKERHPELAVKLFKCAAVGGNMHALCNLGLRYAKGDGIEQDESRAVKLFERAALQGNSFAENNVGYMYLNGKGVEPDSERGLYWLYKAANHGYEQAVNTIWKYHKSIGETDQYVEVVRRGAQMGIEECRAELEMINMLGAQRSNNVLNYSATVNNPTPVYNTTLTDNVCPVCGGKITPQTTVCPHCKETIWETDDND